MSALIGTWTLESAEGFDDLMKHLGVNFVTRKIANGLKPDLIISKASDGTWKVSMKSTFKNVEFVFKEGVQFDETTADGRQTKSSNSMIHKSVDHQNHAFDMTIKRIVDGDRLTATTTCGEIVAKRVFVKKQDDKEKK